MVLSCLVTFYGKLNRVEYFNYLNELKLNNFRSLFIAFHTDNWVYPILRMLPPVHRGMFIGSNMLFTMFLYKMGEYLNSYFWAVKVKAA